MSKKSEATQTTVNTKAKDLKPKKDAKGGGLLLPAVQKVREAAARPGG